MKQLGEILNVVASIVSMCALLLMLAFVAYLVLTPPSCPAQTPPPIVDNWQPPPPEEPWPGRTRFE